MSDQAKVNKGGLGDAWGEAGRAAPRLLSITKPSYNSRQLGSDLPLVAVGSGGSGRLGKTPPPPPRKPRGPRAEAPRFCCLI